MTDLQLEVFSLRKAEPALESLLRQVPPFDSGKKTLQIQMHIMSVTPEA